jgi:hypothetical protein
MLGGLFNALVNSIITEKSTDAIKIALLAATKFLCDVDSALGLGQC